LSRDGLLGDETRPSRIEPLKADVLERVVALTLTFKLSNDPKFVDKLRDVVGLYVEALAPLWATGGFLSPMGELVGAGALMLAGCPEDSPF
jgi:hypothetical protein